MDRAHFRAARGRALALAGAAGMLLTVLSQVAHAHGDAHEAIAALTVQLATRPHDASLYLRRGELHRLHEENTEALADFNKAAELEPGLGAVDFAKGQLFLATGQLQEALVALDRFLKANPDVGDAREARGQVLEKLNRKREAAQEYGRALEVNRTAEPELYLEHAAALAATGGVKEALASLEGGLRRLGSIVTLENAALDLEIKAGEVEAALARIERLSSAAPRKEQWLARRGEVLEGAGRTKEALEAFKAAQAAADTMPDHRRQTAAFMALSAQIESALKRLAPPSP